MVILLLLFEMENFFNISVSRYTVSSIIAFKRIHKIWVQDQKLPQISPQSYLNFGE